jgi:hypothetical protein
MKTPRPTISAANRTHSQSSTFDGNLLEHHRDKLRRCGLPDWAIDALGFYSANDAEGRDLLRWSNDSPWRDASGLVIPYNPQDPGEYSKIRLDYPPPKPGQTVRGEYDWHGGFTPDPDWVPETAMKYAGPVGEATRPYLPRAIMDGLPTHTILLVEGELKAASAACYGQYTVGIAGVWNAHDVKAKQDGEKKGLSVLKLHPALAEALAPAQTVVIGFDSPDMVTKPQVIRAAVTVARMCMDAGKVVRVASVPCADNWNKVGLDDYLSGLPERQRASALQQYVLGAIPVTPKTLLKHLRGHGGDQVLLRNGMVWAAAWFGNKQEYGKWRKALLKDDAFSEDLIHAVEQSIQEVQAALMGWNEPLRWVTDYFANFRINYNLRGQFIQHGRALETKPMLGRLRIASSNANTGIRDALLNEAVEVWTDNQKAHRIKEMQDLLAYDLLATAHKPIEAWLQAVTGRVDPVEVAVLQHWVWSVKRKLHGMPVIHHVMPILVGKSGSGKSVAIEKLLKPVDAMCAEPGDMTILADDRQLFRLAESYVVFFDEMAKAEQTNVESLKRTITSPTLEWRVLGSHFRNTARNNATFIGAANKPVVEIIYDPTSSRRFFQLDSLDRTDWDGINRMDMLSVWRSVNHETDTPLKSVLADVQARQEDIRARTSVEEWLEENGFVADPESDGIWADEPYEAYLETMEKQKRRSPASPRTFRSEVKRIFGAKAAYRSTGNRWRLRMRQSEALAPPQPAVPVLMERRGTNPTMAN